jgi:acyl-CoA reductase-like NAD-dependent aldehyde dehydrogenase
MTLSNQEVVPTEELDVALEGLARRAQLWTTVTPFERAALLHRILRDTYAVAEEWNAAACRMKGLDVAGPEGGEELFSGIGTFTRMVAAYETSMREIASQGRPKIPGPIRHASDGRLIVGVEPRRAVDKLLFPGLSAEVWLEPGVSEAEVVANQAAIYRQPGRGELCAVMGAGNVASLGPRDALSKLFVENKVVVLKANPVNDYLVPYWEQALAALIEPGYLRIVRGGAEVGRYLTSHHLVDEVHITGSAKTFEAIVFGVAEEGARRKAADDPVLTKPITSELGAVSPIVIVPGKWTSRELRYQAKHVATMFVNNAGFNCLTPRVLVMHRQWPQRQAFLQALEEVLATLPTRRAYYPGARERAHEFLAAHPEADQIGVVTSETLPWIVIRDVAPTSDDICFNVEAFCSVVSSTSLEATDTADFIDKAVQFCNDDVWGTLSMTILVDSRTQKDATIARHLVRAVENLRYGSIGVNAWQALSLFFSTTTWGAYPGHPRTDIQSGAGVIGNALLLPQPQKSVVRGPFVSRPTPSWFATNKHAGSVMRRLLAFETMPSVARFVRLMTAALR